MSVLLKLKDANVVNIVDDLMEYTEWQGTFSDDKEVSLHDLTFEMEDGSVIQLHSDNFGGSYGYYEGIEDAGNLFIELLRKVSNGLMEELTVAEFLDWIAEDYISGAMELVYTNVKGEEVTGYITVRSRYIPQMLTYLKSQGLEVTDSNYEGLKTALANSKAVVLYKDGLKNLTFEEFLNKFK